MIRPLALKCIGIFYYKNIFELVPKKISPNKPNIFVDLWHRVCHIHDDYDVITRNFLTFTFLGFLFLQTASSSHHRSWEGTAHQKLSKLFITNRFQSSWLGLDSHNELKFIIKMQFKETTLSQRAKINGFFLMNFQMGQP